MRPILLLVLYFAFIFVDYDQATKICDIYGLCSQRCVEKDYTFECSCMKDFQLAADNRTCNPTDEIWKLVYATQNGIVIKCHCGNESNFVFPNNKGYTESATYDARNDLIYWTHNGYYTRKVYKTRFTECNFGDHENVANTGLSSLRGIAFDWITGNVYIVDSGNFQIVVCGNSSNPCAVVLQRPNNVLQDIVLHPNLGLMFWTSLFKEHKGTWRAEMDGSSPSRIVSSDVILIAGLAIDQGNERVYWSNVEKIWSCRFDGTDRRFMLFEHRLPAVMDILGHRLFWGSYLRGGIQTTNKFARIDTKLHVQPLMGSQILKAPLGYSGLAVVHLANQPILRENPCQNSPCSHICTLTSNHFQCMCPVGWRLDDDGRTCIEISDHPKLVIGLNNSFKIMPLNGIGKNVFEEVQLSGVQSVDSLSYNPVNRALIIRDSVSHKVFQYYNHKSRTAVEAIVHDEQIANSTIDIDPVSENLYWIDREIHAVKVMSLRTGFNLTIFSLINSTYQDISVDPKKAVLYITNDNKIRQIGLDGTKFRVLEHVDKPIKSLSFDGSSEHIFWMTAGGIETEFGMIGGNLTTRNTTLRLQQQHPFGEPVDFATHKDRIYVTTVNSSVLIDWKFKKYHKYCIPIGNVEEFAKVVIMSPNIQGHDRLLRQHDCSPANLNRKRCSHICLPTLEPFMGMCKCPSEYTMQPDNKTCLKNNPPILCGEDEFKCKDETCLSNISCDAIERCLGGSAEIPEKCQNSSNKTSFTLVIQVPIIGNIRIVF